MNYKILGMVGGIGPESTVDYYKNIIEQFRQKFPTGDYPHFIINNINMTEMLEYVRLKDFIKLTSFLAEEIGKLEAAGAEFGVLASNTPHIVFDELQKKVNIPLLSIVEETCQVIKRMGIKRTGLFGTLSTMDGKFYQKSGEDNSILILTPDPLSKQYINKIYFEELVAGNYRNETKIKLIEIAERMKQEENIEGLILGGTELPLILKQEDFRDLRVFDTMQIHIDSIMKKMLE